MEREDLARKLRSRRIIPVFGRVDSDLYDLVRDSLFDMEEQSAQPVRILFDSMGGVGFLALQLGELMCSLNLNVEGVVITAFSAACDLLQYCNKRMIFESGALLVHNPILQKERTYGEHWEAQIKSDENLMRGIYQPTLKRYQQRTGRTEEEIKGWLKRGDDVGYKIFSAEALELNLVDEIVPSGYLGNLRNMEEG